MNIKTKAPTLAGYVWIFTLMSFVGWCFEKVGRYFLYPTDVVRDRGFLTLPLCTIYGTCVVLIGFVLGSPIAPSRYIKKLFDRMERMPRAVQYLLRFLIYFVAVTLLSTLVELVVGLAFKWAGIPLWNYSERWGNLWGVICPSYSLLWGFLITLAMTAVWRPICKLMAKVPERVARPVAIGAVAVILCDFLFNCIYVLVTGGRFHFL